MSNQVSTADRPASFFSVVRVLAHRRLRLSAGGAGTRGTVVLGRIASGTVASGPVAPGSVALGSVALGSVAPGSVAPGSVAPGSVAPSGGTAALAPVACRAAPPTAALDLAVTGRGTIGDAKVLPTPWDGATSKSAVANKGCRAWPVIGSSRRARGKRCGAIGVGPCWPRGRRHKGVRLQTAACMSLTAQARPGQARAGLWVQAVAGAI